MHAYDAMMHVKFHCTSYIWQDGNPARYPLRKAPTMLFTSRYSLMYARQDPGSKVQAQGTRTKGGDVGARDELQISYNDRTLSTRLWDPGSVA